MSFDWSQYFDVAKELYEQAKNAPQPLQEAKYRASISRAYYAVFGKARDQLRQIDRIREPRPLLDTNGLSIGVHQYVRYTFQQSSEPNRQTVGVNLDRLRQYRNVADYDLNNALLNNLPSTTQTVLTIAKKTLTLLNSC
jgi:hypothetical protein